MRILFFFIFTIFFSLKSIGQKGHSNFSFEIYKGNSFSKCIIKNPVWLMQSEDLALEKGGNFGFAINQRVVKDFWLGIGTEFGTTNFSFNRVNPYDLSSQTLFYNRTDFYQKYSVEFEFLKKHNKFYYSALVRPSSHFWISSKTSVSDGFNRTYKVERGILFHSIRPSMETGVSIGRYIDKRDLLSIKLEANYSYFMDVRKSQIIDKMNIKGYIWKIGIVKNFKPIFYNQKM